MSPGIERPPNHLRDLAAIGLTAGLGVLILAAYTTYRIWDQAARDEVNRSGAIVVLGAAQYDGRPSPVFQARLEHAIALFEAGWAPYLVMTGGKQVGDRVTEAETGRRYALAHGVPASAVLMEDRGRTTFESLEAVARILQGRGLHDAIFVSDPTHMLRVLRIARDKGIAGWGSPTRTSPVDRDATSRIDATIHELGALALYFVTGQGAAVETPAGSASTGSGGAGGTAVRFPPLAVGVAESILRLFPLRVDPS